MERRPPEREPDSSRITPTTEPEVASPDSRRRLDSPEAAPRPTRIAFTAKFGPDKDGFPLQLISGDQVRGAETFDVQVIVENRISQDDRTTLLQAQESRDAVADETRRQQDTAAESRREDNLAASAPTDTQTSDRTGTETPTRADTETPDRTDTETPERSGAEAPEPVESRAASGSILDLQV